MKIDKLLIANRGEIVRRVARTCQRLGVPVATVHSEADQDALHVRSVGESVLIGGAPSSESYLNIENVLAAAKAVGANAIHPGIGFLSEDPAFAQAVADAGLIFIGPTPDLLLRFGDKWLAKKEARKAGVPVIEGSDGSMTDAAEIEALVRKDMELPIVLKAAAGGGGRGVRVVRELDGIGEVIESAMREARSSFGRADLIVEQFVDQARHIEVQVAGDGHGEAIHLFERECSLQRRFQKIVEEAPSSSLAADLRERIVSDAVALAKSVGYRGLGTVEFLVVGERHYFLECNPRLQVEHTVTEEITGVDLVELQLAIAMNEALPLKQSDVAMQGCAIQLRLYAEDSAAGFVPSTGTLTSVVFPSDARIETGVECGSVISPHYDSMIAKLIVKGADRAEALGMCREALRHTFVAGVETNVGFLQSLLQDANVIANEIDNRYIDRDIDRLAGHIAPTVRDGLIAASLIWLKAEANPGLGLWSGASATRGWSYRTAERVTPEAPQIILRTDDDDEWPVVIAPVDTTGKFIVRIGNSSLQIEGKRVADERFLMRIDGVTTVYTAQIDDGLVTARGPTAGFKFAFEPYLSMKHGAALSEGRLVAPMMGAIQKVAVAVGDKVSAGDILIV
ncbi:MAG TPA: biotin carboxylase N-terminal domain-containing protein, partial [Sphingomicrobium sp.]